ncbi:MAG: S8 family serine peptidase [Nitriliruptorales bacterium]|nr:S8 family serine peptidase [Nitriliruptorales bacterium]
MNGDAIRAIRAGPQAAKVRIGSSSVSLCVRSRSVQHGRRRVAGGIVAVLVAGSLAASGAGAGARPRDERPVARGDDRTRPPVQPGEVLVKAPAPGRGLERAVAAVSGRVQRSIGRGINVVSVPRGSEHTAAQRLAADPAVEYAEPNYFRSAASHVDGEVGWGVKRVQAPALWGGAPSLTGAGVRIAVIDSGVEADHKDLEGRVIRRFDAYRTGGRDDCGHGTAVAGVAAADHDGEGLAGVAPQADIVSVKVLTYSPDWGVCGAGDAEVIKGIYWVAREGSRAPRADIINMSLSGPGWSQSLEEAVDYAASKGVLIVAAAGNDGSVLVNYPAAYRNVLSVGGAKRRDGGLAWWEHSSFGAVDVVAPAKGIPVIQTDSVTTGGPCTVGGEPRVCADGTSFAAPHVAGLAALLWGRHEEELAALLPTDRVRRLRQWIAGTAEDVEGTPIKVDLKTGHGFTRGLAAADASDDPDRTLLTWQVEGRVLAPWKRMTGTPLTLRSRLVVSNGRGEVQASRHVTFAASRDASFSPTSEQTNDDGYAETVLRSAAGGRRTTLTASLDDGRSLRLVVYVLDRDDNVPGTVPPSSPFSDSLNLADDFDDVFRLRLRDGETVHARVGGLGPREDVALYLHRSSTTDISNPTHPPLREDTQAYADDWTRLKLTVGSDGVRYLHAKGSGTYRLRWWIVSPGMVRNAAATPSTITPNGDGRADRTRITWRVMRSGTMKVRIRNAGGKVVKSANLGRVAKGIRATRWNGRNNKGNLVKGGRYRVTLHWANTAGRISTTSTRVRVER